MIPSEKLERDSLPYCATRLMELEETLTELAGVHSEAQQSRDLAKHELDLARAHAYTEVAHLPNKEAREAQLAVILDEKIRRLIQHEATVRYAAEAGKNLTTEISSLQTRIRILEAEMKNPSRRT